MPFDLSPYVCNSGTMLAVEAVGAPLITQVDTDPTTSITVTAVGGTWTLSAGGSTTGPISAQALGQEVLSTLSALPSLSGWTVTVTGNNPYTVGLSRSGSTGGAPSLAADAAALTADVPAHGGATGASCWSNAFVGFGVNSSGGWSGASLGIGQSVLYTPSPLTGLKWLSASLGGLPSPGLYTVSASFFSASYLAARGAGPFATAARYRFFDGTTLATAVYRGSVTVDQTTATTADNAYVPLANVYCASGTIIVLLCDELSSGGPVFFQQVHCDGYTAGVAEPTGHTGTPAVTLAPVGGGVPTVTVDGGTPVQLTTPLFTDPAQGGATPTVFYTIPKVNTGSTVVFNSGQGVYRSAVDQCNAAVGLTIRNHSGVRHLVDPFTGGVRRMRVGWQFGTGAYWTPDILPANLLLVGTPWTSSNADTFGTQVGGFDADGYPLGGPVWRIVCQSDPQTGVVTDIYEILTEGVYTLLWNGTADMWLEGRSAGDTTVVEDVSQRNITGAADNRRVYTVTRNAGAAGFGFKVGLNRTTGQTVSNARLFDQFIADPYNPPVWHPKAVYHLSPSTLLRTKDLTSTDGGSPLSSYSDFSQPTWSAWNVVRMQDQIPVVQFDSVNSGPFCRNGQYQLRVTFARPHGCNNGQWVLIEKPDANGYHEFYHDLTYADSSVGTHTAVFGMVYVLDATSLIVLGAQDGSKALQPTDLTGQGIFGAVPRGAVPAAAPLTLGQAVNPNNCSLWLNFPHCCTDDLVTQWVTLLAATYPAGIPIYFEYTNEPWNFSAGYPQSVHMQLMGAEFALVRQALGDASWFTDTAKQAVWWYVLRSGQCAALAKAAWVAAGRDPAQLRFVLNCPSAFVGRAVDYLTYAAAHDTQGRAPGESGYAGPMSLFTHVGVSRYWTIGLTNTSVPAATWDALTLDQVYDIGDAQAEHLANFGYGPIDSSFLSALAPYGVGLTVYEAGPQAISFSGTPSVDAARTVKYWLGPRCVDQLGWHFRRYEDIGCETYVKMGAGGIYQTESVGGVTSYKSYFSWIGQTQVAGPGDGTLGRVDNLPQISGGSPPDPKLVDSVTGFALKKYLGTTPVPSFTVSPSSIMESHPADIVLTLTGVNTNWDVSTSFDLSGVAGVTKVGQSVVSATHATVTVTTGTGTGTVAVTDGTATASVTVTSVTSGLSAVQTSVPTSATTTVLLLGVGTNWTQLPSGTIFSASGLQGASLSSVRVYSDVLATATLTTPAGGGTVVLTDTVTGHTVSVTVSATPGAAADIWSADLSQGDYPPNSAGGVIKAIQQKDPYTTDIQDVLVQGIYGGTQAGAILALSGLLGQIATVSDSAPTAGAFRLASGVAVQAGAYVGQSVLFLTGTLKGQRRRVQSYDGSPTFRVVLSTPFSGPPVTGDRVQIV